MSEHAHVDGVYPFPAVMQTRTIETNGTSIHVRVGGHGPAVVMLHGFGTTGDMWGHLASALIEDHMVVAPDLLGRASRRSLMAATTRRIRRRT
jgi:pimeloyl-ACP methyl ester carboxylesterase